MNTELTTTEQRLLWMLVPHPDGEFESILNLKNNKPTREALMKAGLISVEKLLKPSAKRKIKSTHLKLSEAGWKWCNENMSWTKPSGKAESLLNTLLQRLKILFDSQQIAASLGDFINKSNPRAHPTLANPSKGDSAATVSPQASSLDPRIRAACLVPRQVHPDS